MLQLVSFTLDSDPLLTTGDGQILLKRGFFHASCACDHTHIVTKDVSDAYSFHLHVIRDVTCLSVRCLSSFIRTFSSSVTSIFSLSQSVCSLSDTSTSTMSSPIKITALTYNEEYCPVTIYNPLTSETEVSNPREKDQPQER